MSLKWPNDLINIQGQKCGGFICDLYDNDTIIVGVGINMGPGNFASIKNTIVPAGAIDNQMIISDDDMEQLPKEIYGYILGNRLSSDQVLSKWRNYCTHINKEVKIIDGDSTATGIFKDIDKSGMAIIETGDGEEKKNYDRITCNIIEPFGLKLTSGLARYFFYLGTN